MKKITEVLFAPLTCMERTTVILSDYFCFFRGEGGRSTKLPTYVYCKSEEQMCVSPRPLCCLLRVGTPCPVLLSV